MLRGALVRATRLGRGGRDTHHTKGQSMACVFRVFAPSRDLQSVVALYNTVFGPLRSYYSWPVSEERFADKVLSHWEFRPQGVQLAFDGDRLIGFVVASFRSQPLMDIDQVAGEWCPVFLSAIAVDPCYRRRGVGRGLVEKTVEFARANGRDRVKVGANPQSPVTFFIGVQEDWRDAHRFFTGVGFDFSGTCQNMVRSVVGYRMDAASRENVTRLQAEGYACRPYEERDYAALVELLDDHGWAYWHLDMLSKVGRWDKTRPFMETCFLDCATEDILGPGEVGVVVKDGKMLAFCAQTINRRTGKAYLGPMLTARTARGRGLGTVALQVSLEAAARNGAVICDLWTGVGGAITHFYRKSGFEHALNWFEYQMAVR